MPEMIIVNMQYIPVMILAFAYSKGKSHLMINTQDTLHIMNRKYYKATDAELILIIVAFIILQKIYYFF